jgi:hypothetical protein
MWKKYVTVVETPTFLRQAADIWTDEEWADIVNYISKHPDAGDLIPDTGGVRKLRWRLKASGKRGGARVIYFFHHMETPIYLLMAYAKARNEDLSPEEKRIVREIAAALKRASRRDLMSGD